MIGKRNKKRQENEKKRSFNDRFQKRLTTLLVSTNRIWSWKVTNKHET